MLSHWLRSTAEWKQWGCNALIICFLATIFFNVLQGWSLVKQVRTIGRLRSGESVSAPFFVYMSCVFFVFACYGAAIASLAATLNGALGFFYVAVLVRLARYRRFSALEKAMICAVPVAVVAMILVPHREPLLAAILGGSLLPMVHQAYTMRRNRSVGAVEPRFLLVFMVSSTFWAVYAFAIGDAVLEVINPIALAIQLVTIALWLAYRKRPRAETF